MASPTQHQSSERHDLGAYSLGDMLATTARVRLLGRGARSMEEAADRVVRSLHDSLWDTANDRPACVLARLFKTHPYQGLEPQLQQIARDSAGVAELAPSTQCLSLLGTVGSEPAWCSRHESQGHQAIPLDSRERVESIPMLAQLFHQLGVPIDDVVAPEGELFLDDEATFNVFYVPEARESPFVPGQANFVVPFEVRSVLGFGGVLSGGSVFAVILFSRVPINKQTAELFKTTAIAVKLALLPHVRCVFGSAVPSSEGA